MYVKMVTPERGTPKNCIVQTLNVRPVCHAADIKTIFPLTPHALMDSTAPEILYDVAALADSDAVEVHRLQYIFM